MEGARYGGEKRLNSDPSWVGLLIPTGTCIMHTCTGGNDSIRHPALRRPPRFQARTTNDEQKEQGDDRGGMIVMEVKDPALAAEAALSVLAPLAEMVLERRVALMADRIGQGRRRGGVIDQ